MTTKTKDDYGEDLDIKELGLVAKHAYSILRVKTVFDNQGHAINLCMLRNPWGNF